MAKSRETLLEELMASVRSAGQGGLTTAQDLRTFLTSLIDELLDRTGQNNDSGAYCFQVGLDTGDPGPVLMLPTTKVLELAGKIGAATTLSFNDPITGEERLLAIGYNLSTGQFTCSTRNPDTNELYRVYLIGHGLLESSEDAAELVFTFNVGSDDKLTREINSQQAAEYRDAQWQNVAEARYYLNGEQVKLPFKVATGEVLQVVLTRENPKRNSVVRLLR